jgi:hypothetical protein
VRALRVYALLFVVFAVPFGVAMSLASGDVPEGLLSAALGGVLFAGLLGTIDLASRRGLPPGRSNSPRQDVTVAVRPGGDLAHRIQHALATLPAQLLVVDVPAGHYEARTKAGLSSWGSDITVQLVGPPQAPGAHITTRPVLRTVLMDMGNTRKKVDQIITALQH